MTKIQYLTSSQMTKVDKLAMESGISILQMMELAGKHIADFAASLKPKKVIILFGKGNNGGDGLATARHLSIKGIKVEIIPASQKNTKYVNHHLKILKSMGITPKKSFKADKNTVIIDSLLGYNIKGDPKGKYKELINKANDSKKLGTKIISFDIPSGMNPDSNKHHNPYVKADYTLTLALPKKSLKKVKNLYLVNIGIPGSVYKKLRIKPYIFDKKDLIKIS